jgi:histidyl-tRNA synthetase
MKPSIPKGTRDFSPAEMVKRNFVFESIRNIYQRYGYQQIETPAMENLTTLEGKYGEEGDRLLFRVLNSGLTKESMQAAAAEGLGALTEKGLRYDLTVPFARYVVQHQNEISFPFKRFQLQPVWRADRPQKGRYREFYQCDADVIGSTSLLNEVELVQIIQDVFSQLNVRVAIKLNNRKILSGIAETAGVGDRIVELTVAIDKIDKIGMDGVKKELHEKGFSENAIVWLDQVAGNEDQLGALEKYLSSSETGKKGIVEMKELLACFEGAEHPTAAISFDVTLARGLNYYTGTIIEVKVDDPRSTFTSSVCGGGRYDDLTGIFGLPGVSGVGISFGADRICDVLEEVNGFPDLSSASTKILFVNFGKEEGLHCLKLLKQLRVVGINAELFPDAAKMKKQLGYADEKKIPYVALVGSEEMKTGAITVKNMGSGEQTKMSMDELRKILKSIQ